MSVSEILVVDDTPANLNVLRAMLEEQSYRVAVAPSGEIALRIASKIKPALILLDVMMPGIDGYETCRRLKAQHETQRIPVIFVTARTDTEDLLAGFNAGGVDYVSKPFKREEVLARVRTQVQLHQSVERLRVEAERFRAIVNNISDALFICDAKGKIRFVNPAFMHMLQMRDSDLISSDLVTVIESAPGAGTSDIFSSGHDSFFGVREVVGKRSDQTYFPMDLNISPVFLDEPLFIGICRDISQRKDAEALLQQQASTDPLTNLANRRAFEQHLQRECGRAQREHEPLSLLIIDVDFFKAYNDNYGHQQGDRALIEVAKALRRVCLRPTDVPARFGGEEFVILLPNTDRDGCEQVFANLCGELRKNPLLHEYSSVAAFITVSVGSAIFSCADIITPHELIARADKALYVAKAAGRNRLAHWATTP